MSSFSRGPEYSRSAVVLFNINHYIILTVRRSLMLQVPDEPALLSTAAALETDGVQHVVWKEQPEDVATCVALKPCAKGTVSKYVRKFKLYSA